MNVLHCWFGEAMFTWFILLESVSCGSGLSGDYLSEVGHYWVGVDISTAMLGEYILHTHTHC